MHTGAASSRGAFQPPASRHDQGAQPGSGIGRLRHLQRFPVQHGLPQRPSKIRFREVACCGQGPFNGLGICNVLSNLCPDRKVYAFWDPFHPTERATRLIVQQIMTGTTDYMYPMTQHHNGPRCPPLNIEPLISITKL
ncbi:hypothetical protein MLD38_031722 [Melastoma candidum]|uniref:Uncharacterized protein n=1 Tax=Melastoma candidum TaxID=119954 RepID=A0ACB9MTU9_9MYRT|nr:hypothetical protein MLD38_031722 [Melastoma candidum]